MTLGALQISAGGDIVNWIIPGKMVKGIGGTMDLVSDVRRLVAVMDHVSQEGTPQILERCALP